MEESLGGYGRWSLRVKEETMGKTKELVELERQSNEVCAWIRDDSYWNGRIYHERFIGHSLSKIISILRAQGVRCPERVYKRVK